MTPVATTTPLLSAPARVAAAVVLAALLAVVVPDDALSRTPSSPFDEVSGHVLDEKGEPVVDAVVFVTADPTFQKRTDKGGQFSFSAAEMAALLDKAGADRPLGAVEVVAAAEGHGIDWADLQIYGDPLLTPDAAKDVVLRLVKDMPVRGKIVDQQGQPIAGVSIELGEILVMPHPNLSPWLQTWQASRGRSWQSLASSALRDYSAVRRRTRSRDVTEPGITTVTKTDGEGHFEIHGVGRDRVIWLEAKHPDYVQAIVFAATVQQAEVNPANPDLPAHYGAAFAHSLTRARPFTGVVQAHDTGEPLPNVIVTCNDGGSATTNAEGKFQIGGTSHQRFYYLNVYPSPNQPYLKRALRVAAEDKSKPVEVEIELFRGVPVRGRVKEQSTGETVHRASLAYIPASDNTEAQKADGFDVPTFGSRHDPFQTDRDGRFDIVIPEGWGWIAVESYRWEAYGRCSGTDFGMPLEDGEYFEPVGGRKVWPADYHAVQRIGTHPSRALIEVSLDVTPFADDENN